MLCHKRNLIFFNKGKSKKLKTFEWYTVAPSLNFLVISDVIMKNKIDETCSRNDDSYHHAH